MPQVGKPNLVPGWLVGLERREVGVVHDKEDQQEGVHDHQRDEDRVERRPEGKRLLDYRAVVVAQLVEQSPPTPGVHGSRPTFIYAFVN